LYASSLGGELSRKQRVIAMCGIQSFYLVAYSYL